MRGQRNVETGGGVLNICRGVVPRVWGKTPFCALNVREAFSDCLHPLTIRVLSTLHFHSPNWSGILFSMTASVSRRVTDPTDWPFFSGRLSAVLTADRPGQPFWPPCARRVAPADGARLCRNFWLRQTRHAAARARQVSWSCRHVSRR